MVIALILMERVSADFFGYLAKEKRRNKTLWIFLGALTGPFAVVIRLLLNAIS